MTKAQLIKYSANKVKKDKTLFAEFIRLYTEEFGKAPNCSACIFNSTFNRWKTANIKNKNMPTVKNKNNTFKLKDPNFKIRVPFTTLIITKDSSDKDVNLYLNQKGGDREARKKHFLQLPTKKKGIAKKKDTAKGKDTVEK